MTCTDDTMHVALHSIVCSACMLQIPDALIIMLELLSFISSSIV